MDFDISEPGYCHVELCISQLNCQLVVFTFSGLCRISDLFFTVKVTLVQTSMLLFYFR